MNIPHPRWLRWRALASLASVSFLAPFASAQSAPQAAPPAREEALKLEKFVVTGSYIPIAGAATAIPVTVIDAQTIENTGVSSSLLEVLRKTTPQFIGNANLGSTNADISAGGTGGGSAIAFRNTQTLVLLNGRRAAYSPILASGGGQFFDVNLIPISAVERIEVLQDGASAIYGTDAVSGVVNIILKSNFQGFEANARFAMSDNDGHYSERKFSLTGGAGNDRSSITISGEWTKTDPLFQYEREFSAESYGTPTFGGVVNDDATGQFYVLNPSLNAPPLNQDLTIAQLVANGTYIPVDGANLIDGLGNEKQYAFNLARYVTLMQDQERASAVINFEHKWTDAVTLFGDFLYTQTDAFLQINAQPVNSSRPAADPTNPSNQTLRARNRFVEFPRKYFYNSTSMRGIVGLRGQWGGYSWEMAANRNRIEQDYKNENVVNTAARAAAVSSGLLNMFARTQAPGAIEASGMFGTALGLAETTLETYDGRVTGSLMDLPAGELGFAVGLESRVETLRQTSDVFSQTATFGWDSATTLDPTSASREVKSGFVNLRVPIFGAAQTVPGFHLLELEGALRSERYSDTDDPTVPKLTLRWLPFSEEFAVRSTYSESFAAPTLFQLFGPALIGSTDSLSLTRFGGGPNITGQANALGGSNPNLRPSESTNYTVGFVWSPKAVKGFSLSLDWFSIEQTDLITTIGTETILQDVELLGTASLYANRVRFGPADDFTQFTAGAPVTAPGQIGNRAIDTVYVSDFNTNLSRVKLSGLDLKANYTWSTENLGRFDFGLAAGYFDSYTVIALPGDAPAETVGLATFFNGTMPEWQTYFSTAWSRGSWAATLGWTHIPSVTDENAYDPSDSTADAHVEQFNSIDVGVQYTFGSQQRWLRGLTLRLGANNVNNEMPPQAKGSFPNGNADLATYGAIGRLIYVEARYKF
ncbi:MAG TPA: TonB-dependent receptor [Acidobacteriota bacterium]|nr:TonB-dependent receptor [Acidobacteriota bacterium]